jgi:GTP cyclohydrolase II
LKTGRPVRIESDSPLTIVSAETATGALLDLLDPDGSAPLLLSGHRAAALALGNLRDAADPAQPVLVERSEWLDAGCARALADASRDFDRPLTGPLHPIELGDPEAARAALNLARLAGLLPALWVIGSEPSAASIDAKDLREGVPGVDLVAMARLPIDGVEDAQMAVFRAGDDGEEHVALAIGAFGGQPPLVRLHSECLTGDVFGSLKCDCGPQLRRALRLIAAGGGGILLYLRQEGRGIGLGNKLRAYALQDRGLDTVESNLRLGFQDDERDYVHAASILRALGVDRVKLLTNNPSKVAGLETAGISVVQRVSHRMPTNPHNSDYLATKRSKSGHML